MVRDSLSPVRSNGLVERDFGHPFLSLHREMNRLFDMFHDRFGRPPGSPLPFVQSQQRENEPPQGSDPNKWQGSQPSSADRIVI
jgi:HSP20 family protein